jgi:uncharacterized protein (DUF952 family)
VSAPFIFDTRETDPAGMAIDLWGRSKGQNLQNFPPLETFVHLYQPTLFMTVRDETALDAKRDGQAEPRGRKQLS